MFPVGEGTEQRRRRHRQGTLTVRWADGLGEQQRNLESVALRARQAAGGVREGVGEEITKSSER